MTTIACSKLTMTMTTDSALTTGDGVLKCDKITKTRNVIAGASGDANACEAFIRLVREKLEACKGDITFKPPKGASFSGLMLTRDGRIFYVDCVGSVVELNENHAAIGSGSQFALGAMDAGASTEEAVAIAAKRCNYTKLPIASITFNTKNKKA